MKILYLDCFSGVSGNMLLGALLGLGAPEDSLRHLIERLGFDPGILHVEAKRINGFAATLVTIDNPPNQPERHLADIEAILDKAGLEDSVLKQAKSAFHKLASAEARIHGVSLDQIHFHEVGAVDAIVDIAGVCQAVSSLGVEQILCSPLPLGYGTIECAHGVLPVPVPATVDLLTGIPTYSADREGEHVTPTGAALVTTLADEFVRPRSMQIQRTAYGAGTRTFQSGPPNLLRAISADVEEDTDARDDLVIEANIDDMSPEFYGPLTDKLFAAGALDVTLTPCYMKKGRPGTLISVIGGNETLSALAEVLFTESSTIGLRTYPVTRIVCQREFETVQTDFGDIRMKISRYQGRIVSAKPEFEDCRKLAEESGRPVQEVYHAALAAYLGRGQD